jgi:hypothetical protein
LDSDANAWRFPFFILEDTRQNLFWRWYKPNLKMEGDWGERVARVYMHASRLRPPDSNDSRDMLGESSID